MSSVFFVDRMAKTNPNMEKSTHSGAFPLIFETMQAAKPRTIPFSPFGLRRIRRSNYRFSVRIIPTRLLINFVTSSTLFSPEKNADASSMMTL